MLSLTQPNIEKRALCSLKADQSRNLRQKRAEKRRMLQDIHLFITKGAI